MKTNFKDELEESSVSFILVAFFIVILVIFLWLGTIYYFKGWTESAKSSFGDMFGSVNALFSGLALSGIILTILLQRKELSLQRKELRETRKELKRSAIAQENSEKVLRKQAENLKISAKLSALNTLVSYYSELEVRIRNGLVHQNNITETIETKNRYVKRIEEILESKEGLE